VEKKILGGVRGGEYGLLALYRQANGLFRKNLTLEKAFEQTAEDWVREDGQSPSADT